LNKENKTKYLLIVGELEENDLFYHKKNFLDLLQYANAVTCLTDETNQKVKDFFKKEKGSDLITIKISDFLNLKDIYDYKIYTGYLSAKDEIITNDESKVYYLLNNKIKIKDTLDIVCKNNFDKIISHLLPSELPENICKNTYKFICSTLYHIPCPIAEKLILGMSRDKNLIIIYDKNSKHFKRFEKVYKELNKSNSIVLLDIDDLEFSNFFTNDGLINNKSKIVLLDVDDHERLFLKNFCLANDIPISTYGEMELYDREIIDIIQNRIIKYDLKTSTSLRSSFNKILDWKSTSYKIIDLNNNDRINAGLLNYLNCAINVNNDYSSNIGKGFLTFYEPRENELINILINPILSLPKTFANKSLIVISRIIGRKYKNPFPKEVYSKFYNILLGVLLNQENNFITYNILLSNILFNPVFFIEALRDFYKNNQHKDKSNNLLTLSTIAITNLGLDVNTVSPLILFLKSLKKHKSLELILISSSSYLSDEESKRYSIASKAEAIYQMISFSIFLNSFQKEFIKRNSSEILENNSNEIHSIYSFVSYKIFSNQKIDFNYIKSHTDFKNSKTILKNPHHHFRFAITSFFNGQKLSLASIVKDLEKSNFRDDSFFPFITSTFQLLLDKRVDPNINFNSLFKKEYDIAKIIFIFQVCSYFDDLKIHNFEISDFPYSQLQETKNYLKSHFKEKDDKIFE
jgi:hypothetical protein